MLHLVPVEFFSTLALGGLTLLFVLSIVGAEITARGTAHEEVFFLTTDAWYGHISGYLRHYALPNYWVSYDHTALREAIRVQQESLYAFLIHTIYNAVVCTNVLGVFLVFVTQWLAIHSTMPSSPVRMFLWVVPAASFVVDLVEDLAVIVAIAEFPRETPIVGDVAGYASLVKTAMWTFTVGSWVAMLGKRVVAPPKKLRVE